MLLTSIIFIVLLGALVLVHEWGHFIVARKLGVRVEEFAFGFPPRLASFTRRGTRYALNLIPLGGYVKIFGEGGGASNNPESFAARPIWQRLSIIAAGVVMNFVLAWVLFSIGHGLGLPTVLSDAAAADGVRVAVVGIGPGSPAEIAGIQFGDAITELRIQNEKFKIQTIDEVQKLVSKHRGEEMSVAITRGGDALEVVVVPRLEPPEGEGALGIAMARVGVVRSPWWRAPVDGAKTTGNATLAVASALGRSVRDFAIKGTVPADVSGPVGIFAFAADARRLGFTYLLELAGVLSVNLALLNVLPIPALDGGRILFLFLEKLRGGVRLGERFEEATHTIGFALLLLLMAFITYRDIVRVF